ncbi:RNA polymerase sigma factor [Pseudoxanthomonas sp.]|jgi:RNA polymerase sigma factor (sigma-70 family)|uniref:RNA polymerase sigma factor n=1 Tax=Pseudoxanthomonas sp. TaxID=1871049 RepID=UPI003F822810
MTAATAPLELTLRHEFPAAQRGDRDAYGRIIGACQNTVTAIAYAITRDVHASEDIAQEAFLKAWKHLGSLKNPDSLLPWLRQITRNLARDHLRAGQYRPMTGEAADIAIELATDTAPTPAERVLQTEQERVAADVIAALPEDSREVLLLYYRESQSSQQVAHLLGLTDAAVRKRLSRARGYVREELMKHFGEFARSSAPGAAFASAVLGALAVGAPPTAAAAVLGTGSALAGKGLLKVLGASFGAVAFGLIGGIGAVWFGIRKQLREPFDAQERRGLILYGAVSTAMILLFVIGATALSKVPGWIPHVLLTAAYCGGIMWSCSRWLPRILARRRARDMAADPVAETANEARRRKWRVVGVTIGLVAGFGGLLYGLIASGRLTF